MTTAELRSLGFEVVNGHAVRISATPQTVTAPRVARTVKAFVPGRVVSEANRKDHAIRKGARAKRQRMAVAEAFGSQLLGRGKPRRVLLVLLSAQELDDDNLARALKAHRDQVARSCGFNDRERVWRYGQRRPFAYETRGVWIDVRF